LVATTVGERRRIPSTRTDTEEPTLTNRSRNR
jgi:hypothetical protein